MAAASTTGSVQHILEKLVRGLPVATGETTLPIKNILNYAGVTTSNPADAAGVTSASTVNAATVTCTGVALGDIVLGVGVVSGLAANSFVSGAFVSATDTVTVLVSTAQTVAVTTTALVCNILVADCT